MNETMSLGLFKIWPLASLANVFTSVHTPPENCQKQGSSGTQFN